MLICKACGAKDDAAMEKPCSAKGRRGKHELYFVHDHAQDKADDMTLYERDMWSAD